LGEDFKKHQAARSMNGVVGRTGRKIPKNPRAREMIPNRKTKDLKIGFLIRWFCIAS
jgi:hypothetical protein